MSDFLNTQIRGDDTRVAHGADHTIRGGGQMRLMLLDNAGTIEATSSSLRINLDEPPAGEANTNTGLLRAAGGTLLITGTDPRQHRRRDPRRGGQRGRARRQHDPRRHAHDVG